MSTVAAVLSSACAAALLALALAPAGALAHKHSSPSGSCAININPAPRQITAGDSLVIWGRLRCHGAGTSAGQSVKLHEHAIGTPGSTVVQTTTTEALGFYELTLTNVQGSGDFYVSSHGAASGRRSVEVASAVTLEGPPEGTQILTGFANRVTFTGTVSPADVGARVVLQRQNALTGNEWHRIDSGTVQSGGGFSIVHTFRVPGDANLRVLVRSQGRNSPSPSNVLSYEISQAQNPQLTIVASADPILYTQSVTIAGVDAAGTGQPVTLLAHTARQQGFAPLAEVKTIAGGAYTFAPQTPVNSTFYEVRAGKHVHSAVLYEGVKDMLNAMVSRESIPAGQALTFSGSVAPDHSGHVIYLERQNASGTGFHVIEVSTVQAGSIFSISHTVYDT
ncbi:MAG TPA: hypothetical protein VEJ23_09740, partial [Solirubrobacteraceae bacterium]|nr:hypothetical protein [Solirubrobacteraceae bacterium]